MNRQEAFDKALKGVMAQNCASYENHSCKYRDKNGNRCGVGHVIRGLLPENSPIWGLNLDVEDLAIAVEEAGHSDLASFLYEQHYFLDALQYAHDSPVNNENLCSGEDFVESFLGNMKDLAQQWDGVEFDYSQVR